MSIETPYYDLKDHNGRVIFPRIRRQFNGKLVPCVVIPVDRYKAIVATSTRRNKRVSVLRKEKHNLLLQKKYYKDRITLKIKECDDLIKKIEYILDSEES